MSFRTCGTRFVHHALLRRSAGWRIALAELGRRGNRFNRLEPPVCVVSPPPQARSSNFTGNTSPAGDGGAILVLGESSSVTLDSCRFENNVAGQSGGAVRLDPVGSLSATDSVFLKNVAYEGDYLQNGGALSLTRGRPEVQLHGCEISENNSSYGGAVSLDVQGGTLLLNSTRFTGNWARYGGGAVYAAGAENVSVGLISWCLNGYFNSRSEGRVGGSLVRVKAVCGPSRTAGRRGPCVPVTSLEMQACCHVPRVLLILCSRLGDERQIHTTRHEAQL